MVEITMKKLISIFLALYLSGSIIHAEELTTVTEYRKNHTSSEGTRTIKLPSGALFKLFTWSRELLQLFLIRDGKVKVHYELLCLLKDARAKYGDKAFNLLFKDYEELEKEERYTIDSELEKLVIDFVVFPKLTNQLWEEGKLSIYELNWYDLKELKRIVYNMFSNNFQSYFEKHPEKLKIIIPDDYDDEAIKKAKDAIQINPNLAETHYKLGEIYFEKGLCELAIEEYKKAIKINPNFANAHYDISLVYWTIGKQKDALEECKILKELDKEKANELFNLIHK